MEALKPKDDKASDDQQQAEKDEGATEVRHIDEIRRERS
jgi:hypothetical protein